MSECKTFFAFLAVALTSNAKLNVIPTGCSGGFIPSKITDGITSPSSDNCLSLTGNNNYLSLRIDGPAIIYAVSIQGYINMVDTPITVSFENRTGQKASIHTCFSGLALSQQNEYRVFSCRDGTVGENFWIQPVNGTHTLEICEVEVFGVRL